MVCLGFEPGAGGWKARTNPLSYGGTPNIFIFFASKLWQQFGWENRVAFSIQKRIFHIQE